MLETGDQLYQEKSPDKKFTNVFSCFFCLILLPSLSSLARTLDSGLASTLAQLEGLGETDRCSTATSGVSKQTNKQKDGIN